MDEERGGPCKSEVVQWRSEMDRWRSELDWWRSELEPWRSELDRWRSELLSWRFENRWLTTVYANEPVEKHMYSWVPVRFKIAFPKNKLLDMANDHFVTIIMNILLMWSWWHPPLIITLTVVCPLTGFMTMKSPKWFL